MITVLASGENSKQRHWHQYTGADPGGPGVWTPLLAYDVVFFYQAAPLFFACRPKFPPPFKSLTSALGIYEPNNECVSEEIIWSQSSGGDFSPQYVPLAHISGFLIYHHERPKRHLEKRLPTFFGGVDRIKDVVMQLPCWRAFLVPLVCHPAPNDNGPGR